MDHNATMGIQMIFFHSLEVMGEGINPQQLGKCEVQKLAVKGNNHDWLLMGDCVDRFIFQELSSIIGMFVIHT